MQSLYGRLWIIIADCDKMENVASDWCLGKR